MIDESLAAHLHALFGDGDDWAVVGGHAANLYRRDARATVDTDVLVSLDPRTMQEVREVLGHEGWAVRSMPDGGWLLRVAHPRYGSLDVIASETDYQQTALARARRLGDACLSRLVHHGNDMPDDWPEAPPVTQLAAHTPGSQRPTGSQTRCGDLHITCRLSGLDTIGPTCRSAAKVRELASRLTPTPTISSHPFGSLDRGNFDQQPRH